MKRCRWCDQQFEGRSNKVYCCIGCKTAYHHHIRSYTKNATRRIDEHLHRNYSILLEIMGNNTSSKKVDRLVLEDKKFRFKYHTHTQVNKQGKTFHYIYDLAWMSFSDDEVLIIKKRLY
jgi:hypothetical protein